MSNDTDNRVSELDAAVRERDALAAVIERIRKMAENDDPSAWDAHQELVRLILSGVPSDALVERDARIRAEVIDWVKAEPEGPVWRDFIERLEEHFGLTKGADRG